MAATPVSNVCCVDLAPSDYGAPLGRWLTRDIPDSADFRRVDFFSGRMVFGNCRVDLAGTIIPYTLRGGRGGAYCLRRDKSDLDQGIYQELRFVLGHNGGPHARRPPRLFSVLYCAHHALTLAVLRRRGARP
jgi:hypothetical protein